MSNCPMCDGVGKIPQRGAETSGAREVCPTCNGVGTVPEGTPVSQVHNAPAPQLPENMSDAERAEVAPTDAPKADGAPEVSTDSSSDSESGAPETRVCPNDGTEWTAVVIHCPVCDAIGTVK